MNRKKYLFKNTVIMAIGSFSTKFISFFLVPLYTKVLTTTQYGTIDLMYTLCLVLAPLFTLNIAESVMRFLLDKNDNCKEILTIANTMLLIAIILSLIIVPISSCFSILTNYSWLLYFYLISLCSSQIYLAYLKGIEKLTLYSFGNFLQTLLIALLNLYFLLKLNMGIKGYFLAYIISNFLVTLFAIISGNIFKNISLNIDKKLLKDMVKYSVVLIPTSFLWWIMNSSDRVMISKMLNVSANGVYAVSYKIPSMISVFITVFAQAWLFSAIKEENSEDTVKYTNLVFKRLFGFSSIIAIGLFMILKPFLKIYVASDYFISWKYTPFLIIGAIFQGMATFLSTSYNVKKDNKGFLYSGLIGALLNIILNFLLIPTFKVYGAAFATCISYIVVFIYRILDTKKYCYIKFHTEYFITSILLLFISFLTVYIDNLFGQCLLVIEFFIVLFINKDFLIEILNFISKLLKKENAK